MQNSDSGDGIDRRVLDSVVQILEKRKIEPVLVNAQHLKNVPGRKKTDVEDCQWIQHLHAVGLLRGSFRPADEICTIRSLWRHRENLIQLASMHVQQMQKALDQMNYFRRQSLHIEGPGMRVNIAGMWISIPAMWITRAAIARRQNLEWY
jgi:Transposase